MKPIVFCNIAYMKYYRGVIKDIDEPVNGGKYVTENNDGGECYNFEPVSFTDGEMMFGYVMPPSYTEKLHIENIIGCAGAKKENVINNVIVVWCAKENDHRSTRVVGWYRNATVYRFGQVLQFDDGYEQYFNFVADRRDCVLLPEEERRKTRWYVPHGGKKGKDFGFGRSNIWYAKGSEENAELAEFLKTMINQIESYNGNDLIDEEVE